MYTGCASKFTWQSRLKLNVMMFQVYICCGVRVGTSESRGANETFVLDFVVDFNFHLSCILEFLQSAKLNHI